MRPCSAGNARRRERPLVEHMRHPTALAIGIDEAGYGPRLGPLVVTAAAFERPACEPDLWGLFGGVVTARPRRPRAREAGFAPLLVADSKLVYRSGSGLAGLERGALAFALLAFGGRGQDSLTDLGLVRALSRGSFDPSGLPWYEGEPAALPLEADARELDECVERLVEAGERAGARLVSLRSSVLTAREFNARVGSGRNKADVLAETVSELLASAGRAGSSGGVSATVDRLGGRRYYAEVVRSAFQGRAIVEASSGPEESVYLVGEGEARVAFSCRAESRCMAVALASMVSKYARELLMRRLNSYFAARLSGLRPTAGYPADAARFLAETARLREREGIPDSILVRCR